MAGDQVPVTPLPEVVDNAGIAALAQNGPGAVNVGVTFGLMATVKVAVFAQTPAAGVKVYVVVPAVVVLIAAGDQVPFTDGTLVDESGKLGAVAP